MSTQTAGHVPQWTFGDRIRKIRRDAALTQEGFADKIERGDRSVAAWESGRNVPDDVVAVARRIQLVFGVPAAWTLGLYDGPTGGPEGVRGEPLTFGSEGWEFESLRARSLSLVA